MTDTKYPQVVVKLVGEDGNAFAILGRCRQACREFLDKTEWERVYNEFKGEATSGNYDHLLQTVMKFFSADGGETQEDDFWGEDEYDEEDENE